MFDFLSMIRLMRPQQYYKNVLIFLGIVFSARFFDFELYIPLIAGFISLCLISSISYIINDWRDIEADKAHPEKKFRPLASGTVSKIESSVLIFLLAFLIFIIILFVPLDLINKLLFLIMIMTIFITSQSYSLYFKDKAFYDVIFIALNYVWRALAGVVIIAVTLSPWLFILGFLFALFLSLSKRKGDLHLLKDKAKIHKKVFVVYTDELLNNLIVLVSATMIVSYSIYVVESVFEFERDRIDPNYIAVFSKFQNPYVLLLTIPVVTIIVMKLIEMQLSGSERIRKAELLFFDKEIIVLAFITIILVFISLFWNNLPLNELIEVLYTFQ